MSDSATPADSGLTCLSMLERVRADDADAWRRLVQLYSPLVYSWCLRAEISNDDAADLMQEVWGSVAKHIGRFERTTERGTFRGWLWTITRNKLRDFWRARSGVAVGVGGSEAHERLANIPDQEPTNDSAAGSDGLLHRALQLIKNDFEPQTWTVFWRTSVDGVSAAEAGAEVGLSVDAVYQAKSRVLRRLREEMQGLVH
jgi:RNA polymerase sigma-70 factor (ECF subfamily)